MADATIAEIQGKFAGTGQGVVIERVAAAIDDPTAREFLAALAESIQDTEDNMELGRRFTDAAERYICQGSDGSPDSNLVHVVGAMAFLSNYSRKFIDVETYTGRSLISMELRKITAILETLSTENLPAFLDDVLNLNGRLRRRGYPLWFSTTGDVKECSTLADYARRLALGDAYSGPGFRFEIGLGHLGSTPNVRAGEPDHDPRKAMTIHDPTAVDGMYYETFIPGVLTAGGARQYVSSLDNTDSIDRMEIIE